MTEPHDRLPELLAVMHQHRRRTKALRTCIACGAMGAVAAFAWLVAPTSAPVRPRASSVVASSAHAQPQAVVVPETTTNIRIVTTKQVLSSTRVEVRTIAADALAQTLSRKTPCYSLIRMGDAQRLVYSCR